ncbi:class I SAM-dependent methyltransferase [Sphaerisporangium perillae]|uniref:class I SAM-dependent methyltransferase n=1 Tax=Sphaerisporangium perillae TaxID=2935860 RepID=UPI00200CD4C1|nr:class I SAM-dependent methyltransferase [Sphaerisporangium perillae]
MEQFHHPRPVRFGRAEGSRPTPERRHLMDGLTGRVLEIGAGDGVKLTCYPPGTEEIILVDSDPFLRATAKDVAAGVPIPVRVIDGTTARLPVPDASCDTVVCSLVLCCAPQAQAALAEVRRVLRPGGRLRFYEHQRSCNPAITLAERLITPAWSRMCGGCHPAHDVLAPIRAAGFVMERLDHFSLYLVSHVLGIARSR